MTSSLLAGVTPDEKTKSHEEVYVSPARNPSASSP